MSLKEKFDWLFYREFRRPSQDEMLRVNCFPEKDNKHITEADCLGRACLFDNTQDLPHFIPNCHIDRYMILNYQSCINFNSITINFCMFSVTSCIKLVFWNYIYLWATDFVGIRNDYYPPWKRHSKSLCPSVLPSIPLTFLCGP